MLKPRENVSVAAIPSSATGFAHRTVCPRHLFRSINTDQPEGPPTEPETTDEEEGASRQEMCSPRAARQDEA